MDETRMQKVERKVSAPLSPEKFEIVKMKQLQEILELQRELAMVQKWTNEFKKLLLDKNTTQEQVFQWSVSNDIEENLIHIRLK